MGDIDKTLASMYSTFVLRDFCAKVVPGSMVLLSTGMLLTSPGKTFAWLGTLSAWEGALVFGISWIVGFAIQGLGEKLHLIEYFPENVKRDEGWDLYIKCKEKEQMQQDVERLIVIKEACGNASIGLAILLIIITVIYVLRLFNSFAQLGLLYDLFSLDLRSIFTKVGLLYGTFLSDVIPKGLCLVIGWGLVYYLRYMHREHVQRQYDFMKKIVG